MCCGKSEKRCKCGTQATDRKWNYNVLFLASTTIVFQKTVHSDSAGSGPKQYQPLPGPRLSGGEDVHPDYVFNGSLTWTEVPMSRRGASQPVRFHLEFFPTGFTGRTCTSQFYRGQQCVWKECCSWSGFCPVLINGLSHYKHLCALLLHFQRSVVLKKDKLLHFKCLVLTC